MSHPLAAAPAALPFAGALFAFFKVVVIDLVMAGDNAVAVGMAAAGLPDKDRRKAIFLGLSAAVVMLIGFALIAVWLLNQVGLLLAGGVLLLWVCWKMWEDLRHHAEEVEGEQTLDHATAGPAGKKKTLMGALVTILIADLSMSLDNVLAVAGAAREHPWVLVFGLILSVTLMGVAATWIAKLLMKWRWLGYFGLAIVLFVSLNMIWQGHRQVAVQMDWTDRYNAAVPGFAAISPAEIEEYSRHPSHPDAPHPALPSGLHEAAAAR
jgi:YjbE family integral membrane protein